MRYRVAVLCVWALMTAVAAVAEEVQPDAPPLLNENELAEENKRAWANLHGAWGKRGWQDMSSAWGKRAWQDLNSAWGKRGWNDMSQAWGKRGWQDLNSAWGKRAWQDLNSAWGKRAWQDLNSAWGKRAWQDLNSAWGKRAWQDLNSAAWGKRAWQDMSSAWGKRSPNNWANFHGSWGKRASTQPDEEEIDAIMEEIMPDEQIDNSDEMEALKRAKPNQRGVWAKQPKKAKYNGSQYHWKREPNWTNLRGMWGKRSAPIASSLDDEHGAQYQGKREPWTRLRGMWGKRSAPSDEYEMIGDAEA